MEQLFVRIYFSDVLLETIVLKEGVATDLQGRKFETAVGQCVLPADSPKIDYVAKVWEVTNSQGSKQVIDGGEVRLYAGGFYFIFSRIPPRKIVTANYEKGLNALLIEGDNATAWQELRPLAEQGDALAQYALGLMYSDGRGVPKNLVEGARWYRLSAEQGDADAQYTLGTMFADGEGVLKDRVSAHMWYNIAGVNSNEHAQNDLVSIEKHMTKEQIAEATRQSKVCMSSDYQDCD